MRGTKSKQISILTRGSRGDIQPIVALAIELSTKYEVRILSNKGHKEFVESFDLTFVEVWPHDFEYRMKTDEDARTSMQNGDAIGFFKWVSKETKEQAEEHVELIFDEIYNHPPDLLITGTLVAYFSLYATHILKLNVLHLGLQSGGYNPKHCILGLPTLPFGLHYYVLKFLGVQQYRSFGVFDEIMVKVGKPTLSSQFSKSCFSTLVARALQGTSSQKQLICQSSLFRDVLFPAANPDSFIYTGPCIVNADQQKGKSWNFGGTETQKMIDEFIEREDSYERRPVYLGFGSMLAISPESMVLVAVRSLMHAGERGIILGGHAELSMELLLRATNDEEVIAYAKERVLFVEKVSHENLFPRLKCTVHHGGSGTTHAALRSGVPTIITPFFLDQFCHAYAVNKLGVGIGFSKGMRKLSEKDIGVAISAVTKDRAVLQRCREVSQHIREEDGNAAAFREVDEIFASLDGETTVAHHN